MSLYLKNTKYIIYHTTAGHWVRENTQSQTSDLSDVLTAGFPPDNIDGATQTEPRFVNRQAHSTLYLWPSSRAPPLLLPLSWRNDKSEDAPKDSTLTSHRPRARLAKTLASHYLQRSESHPAPRTSRRSPEVSLTCAGVEKPPIPRADAQENRQDPHCISSRGCV